MPMRSRTLTMVALSGAIAMITPPAQAEDPLVEPFLWTDVDLTLDCNPSPGFQRVVRYLDGAHPNPKAAEHPLDTPLVGAVKGFVEKRLNLETPVAWHGLKLEGIGYYSAIDRGPASYSLYFEDNIDEVRAVLNRRGWKIPAESNARDIDVGYSSIGLHSEDGGITSVNCSRG